MSKEAIRKNCHQLLGAAEYVYFCMKLSMFCLVMFIAGYQTALGGL